MAYPLLPSNDMEIAVETETTRLKGPRPEEWARHRAFLTQLWSVENKTLPEVMVIMSQHGHIANKRMYKYHFSKWNLDKKLKERDVVAILQKKRERDAVGKRTTIIVRGRTRGMAYVDSYLKRRKGAALAYDSRASTPSDVDCRTPSPPPISTSRCFVDGHLDQDSLWTAVPYGTTESGRSDAPGSSVDQQMTRRIGLYGNLLSYHTRISYSPSPPQAFIVPEQLFSSIKSYIRGSLDSGTWVTDHRGFCITVSPAASTVTANSADLVTYCYMAVDLLDEGSNVDFRRMLSKGFSIVEDLLLAQHPRTFNSFLETFLFLMQRSKMEIAHLFRAYLSQMATRVLAKPHPWCKICRALGMLDKEFFEEIIIQSYKYTVDTWTESIGPFHRSSLENLLQFINRVHGAKDDRVAERMLRDLLVQVEQQVPSVSPMLVTNIMVNLGFNLLDQKSYIEAEEMSQEIMSRAQRDEGSVHTDDKILALEILAESQFQLFKDELAEVNLREALRMVSAEWEEGDPWAIDYMIRLETWLREWDREDEAEELKVKRGSLLRFDEMDEELDRIIL